MYKSCQIQAVHNFQGGTMERKLVTEEELIAVLNQELHKTENPEDYRFENIIRLVDKDKDGCNWSEVFVRGSGVPVKAVLPLADRIVHEAKKKYNLK